jgi:hypothetical protein
LSLATQFFQRKIERHCGTSFISANIRYPKYVIEDGPRCSAATGEGQAVKNIKIICGFRQALWAFLGNL